MHCQRCLYVLFSIILLGGLSLTCHGSELPLATGGQTRYAIYHAPDAPSSVRAAARDLRHYVRQATGAQMEILHDEIPQGPFISLGRTSASDKAGFDAGSLPPEAFRIVTQEGNVYILGPDTAAGEYTPQGGTSNGTANGVYAFLEKYLGVRWLMPGETGEDVPARPDWTIPALDQTSAPAFPNRRLPYVQNADPRVQTWSNRMKLGYSLRLNHGHNWAQTVPPELFDQHPDWFAMQGGKRVPPVGRYKVETTNPGLVEHYATRAAEALRSQPHMYSYSLSPSDSGGWSTSDESLRLQETDPNGDPSITPLVLDFYIRTANRLKALYPQGVGAGYIYSNYLYPPRRGLPALPDNLYLIVAPSFDYGYRLFRPDVRRQFEEVMNAWTAASNRVGYYDLPINLSQSVGAPGAPGLDILAFLFPRLAEAKVKSVYIYGQTAWGTGAMANYILAKLMWDPSLDPHELAQEYCIRAYGPSAGPRMLELYQLLDQLTGDLYRADDQARYTLTNAMLQRLYGDPYPQIESMFLAARDAATEPQHRRRLEMYEQNLALLQWNLRQRGMIKGDPSSPLYRTDEQINAMLSSTDNTLSLSPKAMIQSPTTTLEPLTAKVMPAVTDQPPQTYHLRGPSRLAFYPLADEEVVVTPARVIQRGELVRYRVVDSLGKQVTSGVLGDKQAIRFVGNERELYFMDIDARSASYGLSVEGAAWAMEIPKVEREARLHFLNAVTPVYFHVAPGTREFTITLSSASPGETAAGEVVSPSGKVHGPLDTSEAPADRRTIAVDEAGTWVFRPTQPRSGLVDDVYISFDASISPWVGVDGRMPLALQPVK